LSARNFFRGVVQHQPEPRHCRKDDVLVRTCFAFDTLERAAGLAHGGQHYLLVGAQLVRGVHEHVPVARDGLQHKGLVCSKGVGGIGERAAGGTVYRFKDGRVVVQSGQSQGRALVLFWKGR
jgi:hypothetical protein